MAVVIFNFIYKYFFAALMTFVVGMFSKALVKQFGNDRADKIKEAILAAMLWAEQEFGIGNGTQKWEWPHLFWRLAEILPGHLEWQFLEQF